MNKEDIEKFLDELNNDGEAYIAVTELAKQCLELMYELRDVKSAYMGSREIVGLMQAANKRYRALLEDVIQYAKCDFKDEIVAEFEATEDKAILTKESE